MWPVRQTGTEEDGSTGNTGWTGGKVSKSKQGEPWKPCLGRMVNIQHWKFKRADFSTLFNLEEIQVVFVA